MKFMLNKVLVGTGVLCVVSSSLCLATEEIKVSTSAPKSDISLKLEVQHAIDKGIAWLAKAQTPAGYWSQAEYPALTGLALTGIMGEPSGQMKANPPDYVVKGYNYLLSNVQADGGIYAKDMPNYNTSVSMMALVASYNPSYEPIVRKARNYVVGLQSDFDKKGETDNPYDGGIGYGSKYEHSDMSNTMFALEAIYYTKFLADDKGGDTEALKKLNWDAALKFIQRSQNLPGYNDQSWVTGDPQNKGGFIYFPGDSKAGEMELPAGTKALRSYGSISYAGMLSYAYADLKKDDPRVQAVFDWLQANYTLDENPGMGGDGLYYYYMTMAKALTTFGVDTLTLKDGKQVNWRKDLAVRMLDLQKNDGMWVNDKGRWWEKDPNLVTAYSLIVMEILHRGL